MTENKRILIVEDHPLMRNGLKILLGEQPDYSLIGEAATVADGRRMIAEMKPDCVLLDISLPDGSGLEILKDYKATDERPSFIVLTMHKESPYLTKAVEWGADGFVLKDMAPENLLQTMRRVENGERALEAHVGFRNDDGPVLSPRESKVKDMLVDGKSLTEIGRELGLSVKTISTYRARILSKLGLKNNAELIKHELA